MYNEVLGLPVPEEATIIGFAYDLALVVVARHPEDADPGWSWLMRKQRGVNNAQLKKKHCERGTR